MAKPHEHTANCHRSTLNCPRMEHSHRGGCYEDGGLTLVCPVIEHVHTAAECYRVTLECGQ